MSWSSNARETAPTEVFEETGAWQEGHWFSVTARLFEGHTKFQHVQVLETAEYGKMLVLDGHTQSSEDDEDIYHECLVQPGMLLHPAPKHVLIIGGGEGATAREALLHPTVEEVCMVDLDGELVDLCREHLPEWHEGAFDDPRLKLIVGDGLAFLAEDRNQWDVIILDLVDAYEAGPSEALFARAFYEDARARLAPGGVLVVQAMELSATFPDDHLIVRRNLDGVFRHMTSYSTFVPSFWCEWGYIVASDTHDLMALTAEEAERRIRDRGLEPRLDYLDGMTLDRIRQLPKPIRAALASDALLAAS